jgi:hypothetical protein
MQQKAMAFEQKITGFAEQLHLPFILANWYSLWRAILRDLPHPDPPRVLHTERFKTLPRSRQVEELMRVSPPILTPSISSVIHIHNL